MPETKTDRRLYLSVVIPFFNEEENIDRLWTALHPVLEKLQKPFEVIFVDDGSTDSTRERIRALATRHAAVKGILFRSNFGQSAAMAAGFDAARGEIIVAMDGDLQNDPRDIPVMLEQLNQGYDVVSGWRRDRKDKLLLRKIPSKIANKLICSMTDVRLHDTGCSLKAFRGEILHRMSLYGEMHRFIPAMLRIEGAQITEIPVRHHARRFGQSKYNLSRTFRVIMDLTTIRLLMRHLKNPLSFFFNFSLLFFIAGSVSFYVMLSNFLAAAPQTAQINILITLTLLLWASALQFLFLGLIGRLVVESGSRKGFFLNYHAGR